MRILFCIAFCCSIHNTYIYFYTHIFFHFVYFVKCTRCSVEFVRHHHARSRARNNDRNNFFSFSYFVRFHCLTVSLHAFSLSLCFWSNKSKVIIILLCCSIQSELSTHTIFTMVHNHKCISKLIVHKPY